MTENSPKPPGFWEEKVAARVKAHGWGGAAEKSFGEVKTAFSKAGEGNRMAGFARVGSVAAGASFALHALKSRTADGEERSGLVRLGEGVLGVGMMAGGVLAGGR